MEHLAAVLVMGFAAYRITQLIVHDSILDPLRGRLEIWHAARFESKARTFVRDLLSCTYCTGFWVSAAVTAFWAVAGPSRPLWATLVDVWAVAGVQALLNRRDDTL